MENLEVVGAVFCFILIMGVVGGLTMFCAVKGENS